MFPREDCTSHDSTNSTQYTEGTHIASLNPPIQSEPVRLTRAPAVSSNLTSPCASVPPAPEISVRLKWNRIQRSQISTSFSRRPSQQQQQHLHELCDSPESLSLLQDSATALPGRPLDDALRAKEASYVFTADGGQRLSPPLEGLFGGAQNDEASAAESSSSLHASSSAPALAGEVLLSPTRQVAEQLDLQTCRRIFAASRHQQQQQQQQGTLQNQNQQQQVPSDTRAEALSVAVGSSSVNPQQRSQCRTENGSAVENVCGSTSVNGESCGGFTHNMYTHMGPGDAEDDISVTGGSCCGCRCCSFASLLDCCGCAAREENESLQSLITPRPRSTRCCNSFICQWVVRLFRFVNIFSSEFPLVSRTFCVLNFIAGIFVIVATCAILVEVLNESHQTNVKDGSPCQNYVIDELLTPDLNFSIICFFLNGIILLVFSLRAVRYENKGLLICHFITVVLQISRVLYFILTVDTDYIAGTVRIVVEVCLFTHGFFILISCCTYCLVSQSFGWRTFKKGITQSLLFRRRTRYMHVQSCVQLDIIATLNACVALVFVVVSNSERTMAMILTAISVAMTLLFVPLLRLRATWYFVLFTIVAVVSLTFYFYSISSVVNPYLIRKSNKCYAESECYQSGLHDCLQSYDISIVAGASDSDGGEELKVTNDTDTYIPTCGVKDEYFLIHNCDEKCFDKKGNEIMHEIEYCCKKYARCRLYDAVRSYGGIYLGLISTIAIIVRLTLVNLAFRTIYDTEEEESRGSCPAHLELFRSLQGSSSSSGAAGHSQDTLAQMSNCEIEEGNEGHSVQPQQESHSIASTS